MFKYLQMENENVKTEILDNCDNSAKMPVLRRYSCSLVYQNPTAQLLRVLITYAYSTDEALGKTIKYFEAEAKDFGLTMKCVISLEE